MAEPAEANPQTNLFTPPADPPPAVIPKPIRQVSGTKPTPPTNTADMSPQARWLSDKADLERSDPWMNSATVLTRDANGNLVAHEKITDADGNASAGRRLDENGVPQGEAEPRQDNAAPADNTKIRVGQAEFTAKELNDIVARDAAEQSRRLNVPADPSGYKIQLPADFRSPAGMIVDVANENDPRYAASYQMARQWAKSENLSQESFSKLLGLHASIVATEQAGIHAIAKAEAESLGANGPARMNAIGQFLRANYGDAKARPVMVSMATRAQVEIFEDLIGRLSKQGSASFNGLGRDPEPLGISDEAYEKMTYTQKLDYAREATARAQNGSRRR